MAQSSLRARLMESLRKRMLVYGLIVAGSFAILIVQLFNLQIIQGGDYAARARINMENNIPILASRGEIYDRNFVLDSNNVILVSNRPAFNLTTIPSKFKSKSDMRRVIHNLSLLLGISEDSLLSDIASKNPWERILLVEDVSFDVIVKVASHAELFGNIDWEDAPVRVYNYGAMFSHVTGYIGSISQQEYAKLREKGYRNYHKIGKFGVEGQYDEILRGKDGYVRRIVDVKNRIEDEAVGQMPSAGSNVVLTVDFALQQAAYNAMQDVKGCAIVIKPATGEILALVSKPDFDPNVIVSKNNASIVKELNADKDRPFLNRAIQSKYPPASTFKLMTAITALETENAGGETTFYCPGKYTLKGYRDRDFYCYGGHAHGMVNMYGAIGKSCSVYFYNLGYKIGPSAILRYADYFGLNSKTEIDLPGEIPGFLPSKTWKMKTFGQPWYDGDTINMSIGQGFISVTPIGMVNFVAALVNNGMVYKPHIIKEIRTPDNSTVVKAVASERLREIPLSPSSLNVIKTGMRLGVTSGTSAGLSFLKVPVAGKTGTAQTRSRRFENLTQHAWFVGFGPYNAEPEDSVAVAVFVEYGIAGAVKAVPVAERIFSKLYDLGYFQ